MEDNILAGKLLSTDITFDDVLIAPRYSTVVPSEVESPNANCRVT
jgi:IMP dehydrogenase/GMP reductase